MQAPHALLTTGAIHFLMTAVAPFLPFAMKTTEECFSLSTETSSGEANLAPPPSLELG